MRKILSSFTALNSVQFLTALNDNIYKLLLIFFLIHIEGMKKSNLILSLAGMTFVIPFLLFASLSGTLADKFSKRSIITITRVTEIFVLILGTFTFVWQSAILGYSVLFLMATQSALFSPCKFGIIPEIVKQEKISYYNGIMSATTFLAIIVGTFLASFLVDVTHRNFILASLVCVVIAICGALFSFGIKKTVPQAPKTPISFHFISNIFTTLKKASRIRYLIVSLIFGAYFLFMGAYIQLNIIPFTIESLHRSEIQGGYLFLMTAIGIGIGSFLAGKASGKEVELGFVPLAAFGMGIIFILLYFFENQILIIASLLVLLGLLGGFYTVPITTYIQIASPIEERGQNVAASNFLSFIGVILASFLIWFLGSFFELKASIGFLIIGLFTFFIAFTLLCLMLDQVLRFSLGMVGKLWWDLDVTQEPQTSHPFLLIAPRHSWLDTVIVMATLPRRMRYVVPLQGSFQKSRKYLYRLFAIIAIDMEHFTTHSMAQIEKELKRNRSVCLMLPIKHDKFMEKVSEMAQKVPVMMVEIKRKETARKNHIGQFFSLFGQPIQVKYRQRPL